jgi:hypothetical protein
MNANLVKYGKYGAVALVVGLIGYGIVQKNKKAKAELESKKIADAQAKKIADAKKLQETRLDAKAKFDATQGTMSWNPASISALEE